MKQIKMIKTTSGAPDGIHPEVFKAGEVYNVNDDLHKAFVKDLKIAEDFVGEAPKPDVNKMTKSQKAAYSRAKKAEEKEAKDAELHAKKKAEKEERVKQVKAQQAAQAEANKESGD